MSKVKDLCFLGKNSSVASWREQIDHLGSVCSDLFGSIDRYRHKNIQNTATYINLENSLFTAKDDEFHVAVAKTLEEACKLLEVGFEYVTDMDRIKLFRKRK